MMVIWSVILILVVRLSLVYTLQLEGRVRVINREGVVDPLSKVTVDSNLDQVQNLNLRSQPNSEYEKWSPGENYFIQKVDHFNLSSTSTYKQKFYVNQQFYQPGSPALVYLGGEGALPSWRMASGLTFDLCRQLNCMLFGLEHRFYGKSQPFPTWSTQNLKYLTIEQSLQDIQHFIQNVFPRQGLDSKGTKWLVVGGSYPANLAVWSKSKFPNLIHAAIGSSAPLEAQSDFWMYDKTVQLALGDRCASQVDKVTKYLDHLYDHEKEKLQLVKQMFGCERVNDDLHFLYTVADSLSTIVQYNSPESTPSLNQFCTAMTQASDSDLLAKFIQQLNLYYESDGTDCYKFSGDFDMQSTKVNEKSYLRQWTYQSCNQFGYWQTATTNSPTRSKHLNVEWFRKFFCDSDYYQGVEIKDRIDETNRTYMGKNLSLANTILTNGQLDPWSTLSILPRNDKVNSTMTSRFSSRKEPEWMQRLPNASMLLLIKDASHVTDLNPPRNSDSKELTEVRKVIHSTVKKWFL